MKRNLFQKLGDFVLGKGFYIVLFLCVAAIGISGYYLIRTVTGGSQPSEPVTANPTVTLPDSSAQEAPPTQPLEEEVPEEPPAPAVQEDDPQPVKEPVREEETARKSILVAADAVGAGIGERVLVVSGSTARKVFGRDNVPADLAIVGIIDNLEIDRTAK